MSIKQEPGKTFHDVTAGVTYRKLNFLGKGRFAKCYEIQNVATGEMFAGKIVSKVQTTQKEKITQEIEIHKTLEHLNIVAFHSHFDDLKNIYVVLELCKNRSMMELHKRRKFITEKECRFYMQQIVSGVKYLHDNRIIHRDLKLENLFFDDDLCVKIGNFGLATRIEFVGERKFLGETSDYSAPEIINKKEHSYEVDIWSIGCIMYTLLVGQSPFDTNEKIIKCDYKMHKNLNKIAAEMIIAMLQAAPEKRPTADQLVKFDFIKNKSLRNSLPVSCLSTEPRGTDPLASSSKIQKGYLEMLEIQLTELLNSNLKRLPNDLADDLSDPASKPLFWVSKWADYADKYGFGYELSDGSLGFIFNDTTKLIVLSNGVNVHYVNKEGKESYLTTEEYEPHLHTKMKLLTHFKKYMTKNLVRAGANAAVNDCDNISRIPYLYTWMLEKNAVVLFFTNGTLQINFPDHQKIVLCPLMKAVTFMDVSQSVRTYPFSTINEHGCSNDLYQKLSLAKEKLAELNEKLENRTIGGELAIDCDGTFEMTDNMKEEFERLKNQLEAMDKKEREFYGKTSINFDALVFGSFEEGKRFFGKDKLNGFFCKVCPKNENGEPGMKDKKAAVIARHISSEHIKTPLAVETFIEYVRLRQKIKIDDVFYYKCPFCSYQTRSNEKEGAFKFQTHLYFAFGYKAKGQGNRDVTIMPNLERIKKVLAELTKEKIDEILENKFENRDKTKIIEFGKQHKKL